MKVTFEENYKDLYTINEVEAAKIVIKYEKENDSENVKEWAKIAADYVMKDQHDYVERILEASAETTRNNRACHAYGEGSGRMDVWVTGIAKTFYGYLEFGAYLTDIWQTGAEDYRNRMWTVYTRKQGL